MTPQFFPLMLAVLDFFAAVVYLVGGDLRHAIYWFSAMTLTLTVTL